MGLALLLSTLVMLALASAHVDPNDLYILVMGVTGSGKSSFIRHVTGNDRIKVCNSIASCTTHPEYWRGASPPHNGHDTTLTLIDTPGFNDPNTDDVDNLRLIAEFLKDAGRKGIYPRTVLYMHRVTERFDRSAMTSLAVLKELVGPEFFESVVFVNNIWEGSNEGQADVTISQLISEKSILGDMVDSGARTLKYYHNSESASSIINHLSRPKPKKLLVQRQMVDSALPFEHTKAFLSIHAFRLVDELVRLYKTNQLSGKTVRSLVEIWLNREGEVTLEYCMMMFDRAWYGINLMKREDLLEIAFKAIHEYFQREYVHGLLDDGSSSMGAKSGRGKSEL